MAFCCPFNVGRMIHCCISCFAVRIHIPFSFQCPRVWRLFFEFNRENCGMSIFSIEYTRKYFLLSSAILSWANFLTVRFPKIGRVVLQGSHAWKWCCCGRTLSTGRANSSFVCSPLSWMRIFFQATGALKSHLTDPGLWIVTLPGCRHSSSSLWCLVSVFCWLHWSRHRSGVFNYLLGGFHWKGDSLWKAS